MASTSFTLHDVRHSPKDDNRLHCAHAYSNTQTNVDSIDLCDCVNVRHAQFVCYLLIIVVHTILPHCSQATAIKRSFTRMIRALWTMQT